MELNNPSKSNEFGDTKSFNYFPSTLVKICLQLITSRANLFVPSITNGKTQLDQGEPISEESTTKFNRILTEDVKNLLFCHIQERGIMDDISSQLCIPSHNNLLNFSVRGILTSIILQEISTVVFET
jgi:hypothetical protein